MHAAADPRRGGPAAPPIGQIISITLRSFSGPPCINSSTYWMRPLCQPSTWCMRLHAGEHIDEAGVLVVGERGLCVHSDSFNQVHKDYYATTLCYFHLR